jgi:hypothetical protein
MKNVRIVPFTDTYFNNKTGFNINMVFEAQVTCECDKFYRLPLDGSGVECEKCNKIYFVKSEQKTFSIVEEERKIKI